MRTREQARELERVAQEIIVDHPGADYDTVLDEANKRGFPLDDAGFIAVCAVCG